MKLLFVPLDIEVIDIKFDLGEKHSYHINHWETFDVINYQNYSSLLNQLPIRDITIFTHKIQKTKIGPHYDYHGLHNPLYEHFKENEPAGYHVVLKGKCDSLEIFNGKEWINPILPKVPIVYLLNLTSCIHRVKEDNLRETLYIQGWLDIEKHNQLIERSLKQYGDLAVYKQN